MKEDAPRSFLGVIWDYKWWWIVPLVLLFSLFGVLLYFINLTDTSPFDYELY